MRERLTTQFCVYVSPSLADKIKDVANDIGIPASEVIREYIENDLDKLRDRTKKRMQRQAK